MATMTNIYCPSGMSLDGTIKIIELMVKEGDFIKKGEVIIVLESNSYELKLEASQDALI